jgi:hypothetical protein
MLRFPLKREHGRLRVLQRDQHLLRRFGQLDLIEFESAQQTDYWVRGEADEIWVPIDGLINLILVDRRFQSPSLGRQVDLDLDAGQPEGVLIPFGVAHAVHAKTFARLLRLASHVDGSHPEDSVLTATDVVTPSA